MRKTKKMKPIVSFYNLCFLLVDIDICVYLHTSSSINFFPSTSFIFGCFNMVSNYRNGVSGEKKTILTANEMRFCGFALCFFE